MTREVVVLSGVRTAIGNYGGSLKDISPSELAAKCVREAVKRAGVEPADVGESDRRGRQHLMSQDAGHESRRPAGPEADVKVAIVG